MDTWLAVELHARNTQGRDFVVGDLHGCLDAFKAQLDRVGFDPLRDRVFSVGDLVDRGDNSFETLALLKEPWFFAVRGNHEDMMLSYFWLFESDYHAPSDFFPNGGGWVNDLTPEQRQVLKNEYLPLILALPYVRTISHTENPLDAPLFHVAHSELIDRKQNVSYPEIGLYTDAWLRDQSLGQGMPLKAYELSRAKTVLTWGRKLIAHYKHEDSDAGWRIELESGGPSLTISDYPVAEGLSPTFVGHTIVKNPIMHLSHIYLDGGAFTAKKEGGQLFMVDALNVLERLAACRIIENPTVLASLRANCLIG